MFKILENIVKDFLGKTEPPVISQKELYCPYVGKGGYLAIRDDWSEVVAIGRTVIEAIKNAESGGYHGKFCIEKTPEKLPKPLLILATA